MGISLMGYVTKWFLGRKIGYTKNNYPFVAMLIGIVNIQKKYMINPSVF